MSDVTEVKYQAGIVTSYGAAKKGGYTGTYAEFCAEQAGFAENAQQVAEDRAAVEELVPDVRAELEQVEEELNQAVADAKDEIDTKAQDAIDSIPADYTALTQEVNGLKSDFSDVAVITKTVNLINPAEIVVGTIDNNGDPQPATTYRRTDEFIPVEPNITYSFRRLVNIYTYNSNKVFIEKLSVGTSEQSRTFGSNVHYIKATSNVDPEVYRWELNEGNTLIDVPWVQSSIKLASDVSIEEQIDTTLTESGKAADAKAVGELLQVGSVYNHGPYIVNSADFTPYYTNSLDDFTTEEFDNNTTYSYVIDKFDALMTLDSGYVAKNTLGQASGTDLYIYEYVITPHNYSGGDIMTYIPDKVPVILCNASIHGFEKNSTYALYYFIKDLLTNWQNNPVLEALRNSVCIKFIPVSNPYGFNNDIYYNANDVNINRNFDTPGWTPVTDSESQNTGLEPFDQPESQIIRDWLNANKTNALMFYDIHTNGHYYTTGYNNANSLLARVYSDDVDNYFKRLIKVFVRHIERQTVKLPTLYNGLTPANNEFIGRYQENRTNYGTSTGWGALNGFLCMTFEMFNGLNITGFGHVLDLFTADTKKCCSEMLGNIIAETIMEYSTN